MKKISQKEKNELVTKGFLSDYLDSKNYVTKDFLEERLVNFKTELKVELEESFIRHTNSLMEFARHENQLVIEALISRIERVERHVGLTSF